MKNLFIFIIGSFLNISTSFSASAIYCTVPCKSSTEWSYVTCTDTLSGQRAFRTRCDNMTTVGSSCTILYPAVSKTYKGTTKNDSSSGTKIYSCYAKIN